MRLDHPVFNGPLKVELPLESSDVPLAAGGVQMTWEVHVEVKNPNSEYGMVSDGYGFEDSPDCERISGGINSKGPMSVAIGRQANMLHWGFYGAPDRMTASARRVFLNAIVYMTQFAGDRVLVEPVADHRSEFKRTLSFIHTLDTIQDAEQRERFRKYVVADLGQERVDAFGLDPVLLTDWYDRHEEYLFMDVDQVRDGFGPELQVDRDLLQLKLPNRSAQFLPLMIQRLAQDPNDALAQRLLDRYLGPDRPSNLDALRSWYAENVPYLFFSDRAGYCWMVDTNAKTRAARGAVQPTGSFPVEAGSTGG